MKVPFMVITKRSDYAAISIGLVVMKTFLNLMHSFSTTEAFSVNTILSKPLLRKHIISHQPLLAPNHCLQNPLDGQEKRLPNSSSDLTQIFASASDNLQDTVDAYADLSEEDIGRKELQPFFSFPIDSWQASAGGEILKGKNVVVCAPTGAGKTVVGEMALRIAFEKGMNAIYTTPLKALTNQKFAEMRKMFGKENVGLSTGDISINRGARITVMTTEVYRNMAWRTSHNNFSGAGQDVQNKEDTDLQERFQTSSISSFGYGEDDLLLNSVVVLDEFHYMGQPGRGGVWEESVITSPLHTQIIGLSATLPNAHCLCGWMESVTGRATALVEAHGGRPVPLRYLFATRDGLEHMFRDPDAGPGSPKGLFGLWGDKGTLDIETHPSIRQLEGNMPQAKLPNGLSLNPKLQKLTQRRLEKVDRIIAKRMLSNELEANFKESYKRKRRPISGREERKERERLLRQEMRKEVPSIQYVLRNLQYKKLLPAIFFIFSRAGCDEAAKTVCDSMLMSSSKKRGFEKRYIVDTPDTKKKKKSRSRGKKTKFEDEDEFDYPYTAKDMDGRSFRKNSEYLSESAMSAIIDGFFPGDDEYSDFDIDEEFGTEESFKFLSEKGLLTLHEVKEVSARISVFNEENEEIQFDNSTMNRFLCGVGSHHAGQLPAHKAFTETLYRSQLMKVVFATETLAAGINMPARTTVICNMAKRGDNAAMNLLETSNLLQMAGRAGRRGMDTDGTCVIVATKFEGPEDAVSMLTSSIKPIKSQFSPSYSLAVNLIFRGNGKLDIAKNLVKRSFAMWEKQQETDNYKQGIEMAKEAHGDDYDIVVTEAAQVNFLNTLSELLTPKLSDASGKKKKILKRVLMTLNHRVSLRDASKSFVAASRILELEKNTLKYLQRDAMLSNSVNSIIENTSFDESSFEYDKEMESHIKEQKKRVHKCRQDLSDHVFTAMAVLANSLMKEDPKSQTLITTLALARQSNPDIDPSSLITPTELTEFARSAVKKNRQKRKQNQTSKEIGVDDVSLLDQLNGMNSYEDNSFDEMLALIRVLQSFGCLRPITQIQNESDAAEFKITVAGENVGLLGLENSLWVLVAMGGAWDVEWKSLEIDRFKSESDFFYETQNDSNNNLNENQSEVVSMNGKNGIEIKRSTPEPQREAAKLVSLLRSLDSSEIAGYVSCLVDEGKRGGSSSTLQIFNSLTLRQQELVQTSLGSLDRLIEVQTIFSVNDSNVKAQLELGSCEVVTAWADGCTWTEALELSGKAPGDLVRILRRVVDGLRQLGNLPYHAARPIELDGGIAMKESTGIHPDIRRLCKDAATQMDRYPVNDPIPFNDDDDDNESDSKNSDGDEYNLDEDNNQQDEKT
eukprot:CAMPEP_0184859424 /NCGR_PEP_ID=MMETSP0580-20130426/4425_1 /TAXON_ID=1118495 /ORGANISM="Dactyliosolen fragilissimus" /LENGTH=1354 /DNA_ID=CAMNT_0027356049 /DNA_START=127 /DNA_END=4188 /DNA_ORIENTATION=+